MIKKSTKTPLSEPKSLPENWGPIFGLHGYKDKLGDLSWLGEAYADMAWVQVEGEEKVAKQATPEEKIKQKIRDLLAASDWRLLPDIPMTVRQKQNWIEYRRLLREVTRQDGFPDNIKWPSPPNE